MSGVRNAACSSQWDLDMHPSRESNFCCWVKKVMVGDPDMNSVIPHHLAGCMLVIAGFTRFDNV